MLKKLLYHVVKNWALFSHKTLAKNLILRTMVQSGIKLRPWTVKVDFSKKKLWVDQKTINKFVWRTSIKFLSELDDARTMKR